MQTQLGTSQLHGLKALPRRAVPNALPAAPLRSGQPLCSQSYGLPASLWRDRTATSCSSSPDRPPTGAVSIAGSSRGLRMQSHVTSASGSMAASQPSPMSLEGLVPAEESSKFDKLRAALFFCWSLTLAVPLFISMAVMSPFVMALDKYRRLAQHFVNNIWAKFSTSIFYPVEVAGRENLPPSDRPVVYVANHQSFLDIFSLFHLDRPFKFISKASVFYIPIVGWSMFMTGHVMLNRMDRRSQLECLKQCRELLDKGAPVLFFPEGTRSKDCVMMGFKKGAFSVACKAGVDVVPITLLGTGALMPSGSESQLRPGRVRIVVHPPIPTKGRDADEVCKQARDVIASAMPPQLVGAANKMAEEE